MAIKKTAGRTAYAKPGDTTPFFDHIAVWAADTEATAAFFTDYLGWKRHPVIIRVSDDDPTTGGMIGTFFDAPGLWIELIEPTTPGPGQEILDAMGDGALVEINFDVGDEYERVLQDLNARGVEMLSMDGSPLVNGGVIDEGVLSDDGEIQNPGQRIMYFPTSLTQGTTVEYYEVLSDDKHSLLFERDRMWKDEVRPEGMPFIDHVSILVDDIETAANFYTEYMGLNRHPEVFKSPTDYGGAKIVFIDANGYDDNKIWLKLIQPTAPGFARKLMDSFGAGYILELGVQTAEIESFIARMSDKGVTLTGFDTTALADNTAVLSSFGDAECYFPADVSKGIRIKVFERDLNAGLYAQRDKYVKCSDGWPVRM